MKRQQPPRPLPSSLPTLEHARADLVHPALATQSVAAIGRHWGFHDASVFSRAFKTQYGQPPQTYRRMNSRL
jgi:AraC-like DNA-binding protein